MGGRKMSNTAWGKEIFGREKTKKPVLGGSEDVSWSIIMSSSCVSATIGSQVNAPGCL